VRSHLFVKCRIHTVRNLGIADGVLVLLGILIYEVSQEIDQLCEISERNSMLSEISSYQQRTERILKLPYIIPTYWIDA